MLEAITSNECDIRSVHWITATLEEKRGRGVDFAVQLVFVLRGFTSGQVMCRGILRKQKTREFLAPINCTSSSWRVGDNLADAQEYVDQWAENRLLSGVFALYE